MSDEKLEILLERIGKGDRNALRDMVSETAMPVSLMLSHEGHPPGVIRAGLIRTYSELWEGEYGTPLLPGETLQGWIVKLTRNNLPRKARAIPNNRIVDDSLWKDVAKAAFPESIRNLWRRVDIGFILAGAVIWGLILVALR